MDKSEYGFHIGHCCKFHGCKYGDEDCPVVKGIVKQAYLCMDCDEDLQNESYYKFMLEQIEQIKLLKKDLESKKSGN